MKEGNLLSALRLNPLVLFGLFPKGLAKAKKELYDFSHLQILECAANGRRFRIEVDCAGNSGRRLEHTDRKRDDRSPSADSLRIGENRDMAALPLNATHRTREERPNSATPIDPVPEPLCDGVIAGQDAKLGDLLGIGKRLAGGRQGMFTRAIEKGCVV